MKIFDKKTIFAVIILCLLIAGAGWYLRHGNGQATSFRTTQVTRGNLLVSLSGATGTIEPDEVIDVGAQVAGQILSFGKDVNGNTIDYGSVIEEGAVLARIDDSLYLAEVAQAEAQVQSAKAGIQLAAANIEQMNAKLNQAERDWKRAQKLGPSEALAQATYDAYQSAYETAKANVAVAKAQALQADAALTQAEKALWRDKRNLGYCTISSPVRGVIIDRRVNIGQTVVASLNAPSLFLIAKDMKRMQIWVSVNEADIDKIHPGQSVTFTVDAFPSETFYGEVRKVRLNASMTQNVVTYTVEIITDNPNGRLLPYLTATVQFELDKRDNVLLVPNAAVRWTPSTEQVSPKFREMAGDTSAAKKTRRSNRQAGTTSESANNNQSVIWVPDGAYVRPVYVRTGLSDGINTEVEGKELEEGLEVITGVQTQVSKATDTTADTTNPFTPKFPSRGRSSSGSSSNQNAPPPGPP